MGEMADYTNELIELDYEQLDRWRSHKISPAEAYDLGIIDEHGSEYPSGHSSGGSRNNW